MDMEQDAYEVITLDLWDTVIRRKCHPDEIKDKTCLLYTSPSPRDA